MTELTADQARRLVLRAQGLVGADARKGPHAMLRRLGAIQLDTVSVLARSHELVAYARLGPVGRPVVERAYWERPARAFEYWCHAASILPIEHWPWYAFRRRAFREYGSRGRVTRETVKNLLAQVRDSGPVTTADVGGAKNGGPWWDWSDAKLGLEWLLNTGELVCTRRVGWRRHYDLAERAIPAALLAEEPSDEECVARLASIAGRSLGVATRADLIDFARLRDRSVAMLDEALRCGAAGLVPVTVSGWTGPRGAAVTAWADPALLEADVRGRHRTTLVSPFDSLIWHRGRTSRIFGFDYTLELYVPKARRVHGYFTMPVLAGGRLIGRVDPARDGSTFVARQISLEPGVSPSTAVEGLRAALWEAASWVGCDAVRVERLDQPRLLPELIRAP